MHYSAVTIIDETRIKQKRNCSTVSVRGYLHVYIHKTCIHSGEVLEVSDPYGLDECMIGREVGGEP